ncbi:MAG: dihydrodipicolinate synthase family protein [Alphaproteobacteria bacterium]|nr:dihydrodipicolinate synthase family protein [Alphaproteobacteria bacterium]
MPLDATARGVFPIAVTPFLPDGEIDWISVDRMVDFYLSCGADGLTILGIMGEAPKMTAEESIAIVRRVVARAGRAPVIVGVSAPGFAPMRALARASMEAGAAGVMIAPAPALRTDDQIVTYFADAIGAVGTDVPVVVQDYPLTLGVVMAPGVLRRIFTENPSAVMLKHEDWPGLDKIGALRRWQAEGTLRALSILCGNGGLFLDFEMVRGADGAMTGYAFPDMLVDLVRLHAAGDRSGAQDLFDAHLPLLRYEQQLGLGLAVRKHVLMRRGVIAHEGQRKPGAALNAAGRADVAFLLGRLARHDRRAALGPA